MVGAGAGAGASTTTVMENFLTKTLKLQTEVPLFLLTYAGTLSDSLYTNLILYRICYVTMGNPEPDCALLGTGSVNTTVTHFEEQAQPRAAVFEMISSILTIAIGSVVCLVVGPWSDRFGRKPVLLFATVGCVLKHILLTVMCTFANAPPVLLLFSAFPTILNGGRGTFSIGCLAYIVDVTPEESLGLRMMIFELLINTGILVSDFSTAHIFAAIGYIPSFTISVVCSSLALLYVCFFIPESLENREKEGRLKGIFKVSHVVDLYRTTVKKRELGGRAVIASVLLVLCLQTMANAGSSNLLPLFLREKFHWSLARYTTFNGMMDLVFTVGAVSALFLLNKLLKIKENVLILLSVTCLMGYSLIQGLATENWHIYVSLSVFGVAGILKPMIRTVLAGVVGGDDAGKIFSFSGVVCDSLFGTAAEPLYTLIYTSTLTTDPGAFNLISAGLYIIAIIIAGVMIYQTGKMANISASREVITEDNDDEHTVIITVNASTNNS